MPDRNRVHAFIEMVTAGDYVHAIEDFYHADASMRENLQEPRRGRDRLVAHERAALERTTIKTRPVSTFLVDGDRVAIAWTFEITPNGGPTRIFSELTLQRWVGDRIAEEQFFYDPQQLRR